MTFRVIMLGDIIGRQGVEAVAGAVAQIRSRWRPDLLIANAENAAEGSGLTRELYSQLIDAGVDGITLGDHAFRRAQIIPVLESERNIIRPLNLPERAKGEPWMALTIGGDDRPTTNTGYDAYDDDESESRSSTQQRGDYAGPAIDVYIMTVLGRVFGTLPIDEPLAALDRALAELPESKPIVIVEVHAEATAEKQAIGWYLDGRVAAVLGTHTHVATADARLLKKGTAYITDMGMCGPFDSVIGRRIDRVLAQMSTSMPAPFDVADGDMRINGVIVDIDPTTRQATHIERLELRIDG